MAPRDRQSKVALGCADTDPPWRRAGALGFSASSGLAPSVLADPQMCGSPASGFEGDVVLLFAHDTFLMADPKDTDQTRLFWKAVKEEIAADRTLSKTPFTCRGGHWVAATAP
jgi:hypothetical protein